MKRCAPTSNLTQPLKTADPDSRFKSSDYEQMDENSKNSPHVQGVGCTGSHCFVSEPTKADALKISEGKLRRCNPFLNGQVFLKKIHYFKSKSVAKLTANFGRGQVSIKQSRSTLQETKIENTDNIQIYVFDRVLL